MRATTSLSKVSWATCSSCQPWTVSAAVMGMLTTSGDQARSLTSSTREAVSTATPLWPFTTPTAVATATSPSSSTTPATLKAARARSTSSGKIASAAADRPCGSSRNGTDATGAAAGVDDTGNAGAAAGGGGTA